MPKSTPEAAIFRKPDFTVAVRSMKIRTQTLDKTAIFPLPRQTYWVMRILPTCRRARAEKEKPIQNSLANAKSRLLSNISDSIAEFAGITCATDHMLRREAKAAAKEGRQRQQTGQRRTLRIAGGRTRYDSYRSHVDDVVDGGQSGRPDQTAGLVDRRFPAYQRFTNARADCQLLSAVSECCDRRDCLLLANSLDCGAKGRSCYATAWLPHPKERGRMPFDERPRLHCPK